MRIFAVASVLVVACGSFTDAPPASDAGVRDDGGAPATDATTDGSGPTATGCAAVPAPYLLCSDFDDSTTLPQNTKPNAKQWQPQVQAQGAIQVATGTAFSPANFLASRGTGTTIPFVAQVGLEGVAHAKDIVRLSFRMRVAALPVGGDVHIAALTYDEVRVAAVLHANGKLGLAQSAPPGSSTPTKFDPPDAQSLAPGEWRHVELSARLLVPSGIAAAKVDGIGAPAPILKVPAQKLLSITVGIGYCDGTCGTPGLDFDDVVLTEE